MLKFCLTIGLIINRNLLHVCKKAIFMLCYSFAVFNKTLESFALTEEYFVTSAKNIAILNRHSRDAHLSKFFPNLFILLNDNMCPYIGSID